MATATVIAPPERTPPSEDVSDRRTYTCPECGDCLRVFGSGRHRVYFVAGDGGLTDPVTNGACPGCGHGLPGRNRASRS